MRLFAISVVVLTGILAVCCTNDGATVNEDVVDVKQVSCEDTPTDVGSY